MSIKILTDDPGPRDVPVFCDVHGVERMGCIGFLGDNGSSVSLGASISLICQKRPTILSLFWINHRHLAWLLQKKLPILCDTLLKYGKVMPRAGMRIGYEDGNAYR